MAPRPTEGIKYFYYHEVIIKNLYILYTMPVRRRTYGTKGKRITVTSRPTARPRGRLTIPRMGSGQNTVPRFMNTKLTYSVMYDVTASTAVQYNTYRGNSTFDPDYTGTGTQPRGRDEIAALYQKYKVFGSSIKVTPLNVSDEIVMILYPSTNVTGQGVIENAICQPYCRYKQVANKAQNFPMKHFMTSARVVGQTRKTVAIDDLFSAGVGSNPATQWYWHLGVQNFDEATSTTAHFVVEITYYVRFYDPATLILS